MLNTKTMKNYNDFFALVEHMNRKERESQEWWARRDRRNGRIFTAAIIIYVILFVLFVIAKIYVTYHPA